MKLFIINVKQKRNNILLFHIFCHVRYSLSLSRMTIITHNSYTDIADAIRDWGYQVNTDQPDLYEIDNKRHKEGTIL